MIEPKEITEADSVKIRDEWHAAGKPRRPLTITDYGRYFDVRELSIDELMVYIKEKTGKTVTRDQLTTHTIACYR